MEQIIWEPRSEETEVGKRQFNKLTEAHVNMAAQILFYLYVQPNQIDHKN